MEENMKELNEEMLEDVAGGKETVPYGGYRTKPKARAGYTIYQIQSGDNLGKIAFNKHTTKDAIMAANRDVLKDPNRIRAGYFIYIPN